MAECFKYTKKLSYRARKLDKDGIILRSYTGLLPLGNYKKVSLDFLNHNQDNENIRTEMYGIKDELKECKEALKDLANIFKNFNISHKLDNVVFKNKLLLSEEEYKDLKDERKGYLGNYLICILKILEIMILSLIFKIMKLNF